MPEHTVHVRFDDPRRLQRERSSRPSSFAQAHVRHQEMRTSGGSMSVSFGDPSYSNGMARDPHPRAHLVDSSTSEQLLECHLRNRRSNGRRCRNEKTTRASCHFVSILIGRVAGWRSQRSSPGEPIERPHSIIVHTSSLFAPETSSVTSRETVQEGQREHRVNLSQCRASYWLLFIVLASVAASTQTPDRGLSSLDPTPTTTAAFRLVVAQGGSLVDVATVFCSPHTSSTVAQVLHVDRVLRFLRHVLPELRTHGVSRSGDSRKEF